MRFLVPFSIILLFNLAINKLLIVTLLKLVICLVTILENTFNAHFTDTWLDGTAKIMSARLNEYFFLVYRVFNLSDVSLY